MRLSNTVDLPSNVILKPGQRLIRIKGSNWIPVGIGGSGLPSSNTTSIEFYKCASVDTLSKKWSGYKVTLTDGSYTFETIATENLEYTAVTPKVGYIFSSDALISISNIYCGIPLDNLVFYASVSNNTDRSETGQLIKTIGTPEFIVEDGIPCMKISDSNSYVLLPQQDILPLGNSVRTISFWTKLLSSSDSTTFYPMGYGENDTKAAILPIIGNTGWSVDTFEYSVSYDCSIDNTWHHYAATYDGSILAIYMDGTKNTEDTVDISTTIGSSIWDGARFGASPEGNYVNHRSACVAAFRIYDRVLSSTEISELANEFNVV